MQGENVGIEDIAIRKIRLFNQSGAVAYCTSLDLAPMYQFQRAALESTAQKELHGTARRQRSTLKISNVSVTSLQRSSTMSKTRGTKPAYFVSERTVQSYMS